MSSMKWTKSSSMKFASLSAVFLVLLLASCSISNSDTSAVNNTSAVTDTAAIESPDTATSNGAGTSNDTSGAGNDTAGMSGDASMSGVGDNTAGVDASGDAASHSGHGGAQEVAADSPIPTVEIEVLKDPMTGWNLHIETTNYTLAPERVSTEHVEGEGHMHLYINGEKISRIYGYWHDLGELPPGEHEIRVSLSTNSHAYLTLNGQRIEDTEIVSVPPSDSGTSTSQPANSHADTTNADGTNADGMPATSHGTGDGHGVVDEPTEYDADVGLADRTIELNITDGAITVVDNNGEVLDGPQRLKVELNSVVALRVTSDVEEQVHIHGYDILRRIGNNIATHFAFNATLAGVYEVELEGSSSLLLQLTVS